MEEMDHQARNGVSFLSENPVIPDRRNQDAAEQVELQVLLQRSEEKSAPHITVVPDGQTPPGEVTPSETADHSITIDSLLDKMGSPGRYQLLLALALSACMFPVVFCDLATIFYTIHPDTSTCALPVSNETAAWISQQSPMNLGNNTSETYLLKIFHGTHNNTCEDLDSLDVGSVEGKECWTNMQHQFEENGTWSIVAEWNLVCSRYWLVSFATTVYFLGVMIGSMAFGHLADRFGRVRCILGCYACFLPLGIATAYPDTYLLFLILRFFLGFFVQGVQSVSFVLLMEFCSPRYRDAVGGLEGLFGGLAVGALSGAAYVFPHWRQLQLCLIIPCFLALSEPFFLRESLRWQTVHGKVAEARQTVVKVLQWNKLPPDSTLDEDLTCIRESLLKEESKEAGYTWLDCFRTPLMRKYTLSMSFIWYCTAFLSSFALHSQIKH
ncbi:hypothetical protein RvY_10492-2 [Ramazzottius varieornatus]|uniref:Major facilitator superfamily (MFS) profile domain-containing protein n=1 Tax=Ramazzottius varieornatus TaxID=947166 RepID=A0A1D1VCZ7_RAMVA|nr:hypothetical protein RvY_10492-2 [Ramazzottius varieornatus]